MATTDSKIAKTTFETGPLDDLFAQDVYNGTEGANLASAVAGGLGNLSDGLLSAFTPGGSIGDLINGLDKSLIDKGKTLVSAVKNVKTALNNKDRLIDNISDNLLGDMLKSVGYTGKPSDIVNGVLGRPGALPIEDVLMNSIGSVRIVSDTLNVVRKIKDIDSAQDLMTLVGQLTGDEDLIKLFNVGPELSVLKSLMGSLMDYQIPELYDKVFGSITEEKDRKILYLHSALNAAQKSDTEFLLKAINSSGAGNIISLYPDIISVLFKNYRFPIDSEDAPADAISDVIGIANALNVNWSKGNRLGDDIVDLSLYAVASNDLFTGFSYHPDHQLNAMIAIEYQERNLSAILKTDYPTAPWSFAAN